MKLQQILAAGLAVTAVYTGVWALFFPASFYTDFPLFGHPFQHWVDGLGPYNEHLITDVGAMYSALAAISLWAAARPSPQTLRLTGLGWTVFNLPHLVFHLRHLAMYGTLDRIALVATLGGSLLLSALMLVPNRK